MCPMAVSNRPPAGSVVRTRFAVGRCRQWPGGSVRRPDVRFNPRTAAKTYIRSMVMAAKDQVYSITGRKSGSQSHESPCR